MLKKLFITCLFTHIIFHSYGQNSYQSIKKRADAISLLYFQDETEGMARMKPIYSKARGVTVLSAINNVNNRALRKLKTEAAMMGANAVYITNNYQKGVQFYSPVQVSYSAVAYTDNVLSLEKVKSYYTTKSYRARFRVTYNRNAFSEKIKFFSDPTQELTITNIVEENGTVWADLTRNNSTNRYKVIKADADQIIFSRYLKGEKIIENIEFVGLEQVKNVK